MLTEQDRQEIRTIVGEEIAKALQQLSANQINTVAAVVRSIRATSEIKSTG